MKKENLLVIIVGIISIGIGIFFLFFYSKNQEKLIERCTKETQGIITDVEIEYGVGENDSDSIYVTVEYSVGDETYEVRKQSSKEYKEKEQLTVNYNPDDPTETYIIGVDDKVMTIQIGGIVFIIIGTLLFLLGIFKRW